jgi:ferredoxin
VTGRREGQVLAVDPITCDGHGLCADLFPEFVALDEWGYPLIDPRPVPGDLLAHARRAVAGCPTLALRLRGSGLREDVRPGGRRRD